MIDSFTKLLNLLDSNPINTAIIVMFKSQTCPPCKQTMSYLTSIGNTGEIIWYRNQKMFEREHGFKIHFMPIDIRSTVENNEKLLPIVSASQSVTSLPTFDFFMIDNGKLTRIDKTRHKGGLGPGAFETYLDTCSYYLPRQ